MYLHYSIYIRRFIVDARRAKLFRHGGSQAVRLPAEYRFEGTEVVVSRDPFTGAVVLSPAPGGWADFFALRDRTAEARDFVVERDGRPPQRRRSIVA